MGPLSRLVGVSLLATAWTPARAASPDAVGQWRPLIAQASQRFGIPQSWIERVLRAESGGSTLRGGQPIRSRAGAIGLMQLMPSTWATMQARLGLGTNPDDPRDNITAGTCYLRLLYDRFGYPGLFAAYNAGPDRYAAHVTEGKPLPAETRTYLATVTGIAPSTKATPLPSRADPLFFPIGSRADAAEAVQPSSLFVPITSAAR